MKSVCNRSGVFLNARLNPQVSQSQKTAFTFALGDISANTHLSNVTQIIWFLCIMMPETGA
jgi:hypothetical protein